MSTVLQYPHLSFDADGTVRIDRTRYKVIHLAGEHYHYGWSAEEILRQHPDLRPEQVYAALTYFYDHHDPWSRRCTTRRRGRTGSFETATLAGRVAEASGGPGVLRMPSTLYMDVHVPMAVTETLRRRGLDILTSQDDGTATRDDEGLLARAAELGRVLFSQDQDFLRIAAEWQRRVAPSPAFSSLPSKASAWAAWPTISNSC